MCACDLYINLPFVPTRHNPSDDPTRDVVIRQPLLNGLLPGLHRNALFRLSSLTKLRRWASNWIRLILCLLGVRCLDFNDRSLYRRSRFATTNHLSLPAPNSTCLSTSMDFDATLGFPGEGPSLSAWIALLAMALSWTCSSGLFVCQSSLWVVVFPFTFRGVVVAAMDTGPRNQADFRRQAVRQVRPPLPRGRPLTPSDVGQQATAFWTVSGLVFFEWLQHWFVFTKGYCTCRGYQHPSIQLRQTYVWRGQALWPFRWDDQCSRSGTAESPEIAATFLGRCFCVGTVGTT